MCTPRSLTKDWWDSSVHSPKEEESWWACGTLGLHESGTKIHTYTPTLGPFNLCVVGWRLRGFWKFQLEDQVATQLGPYPLPPGHMWFPPVKDRVWVFTLVRLFGVQPLARRNDWRQSFAVMESEFIFRKVAWPESLSNILSWEQAAVFILAETVT